MLNTIRELLIKWYQMVRSWIHHQYMMVKEKGGLVSWGRFQWDQLRAWFRETDWKMKSQSLRALFLKNWKRARNIRKSDLENQWKNVKDKSGELLSSERIKEQRERIRESGQKLLDQAEPFASKAKENLSRASEKIREAGSKNDSEQEPVIADAPIRRAGFFGWIETVLMHTARMGWMQRVIDNWLSMKVWRSDRLFFRFLLPTLALSSIILLFAGLSLYLYIQTNLGQTEREIRINVSDNLKSDIQEKYLTSILERSSELEQIVRSNGTKSAIVADAPTFQELNIQKMEKFSRSLLRKDTNLLNVVVLTSDDVKREIRTRRIGDTTRFLFTCCELPEDRMISYEEVKEPSWLIEIDNRKKSISNIYVNPANQEKYFYQAHNISDLKGEQTGAVLMRYNLNFAVQTLRKNELTGETFLIANDSLVVATATDSIYPNIEVSAFQDSGISGPRDYIFAVIDLIRRSGSQEEAIQKLRRGDFIRDRYAFERDFKKIFPEGLNEVSAADSSGNKFLLSQTQAQAIMDLSFGQLLGLKRSTIRTRAMADSMEETNQHILVQAYLDSMKEVGMGTIVDERYLLSFATNQFGWMLINISGNEEYLAPVLARNDFINSRFANIMRRILWFVLLAGVFFLAVFVLMTTGILYRFTNPINKLVARIADTKNSGHGDNIKLEGMDELAYIGESFVAMSRELETYIQKLEDSNRDLEEYAHVVAHDLREPLRSVGSYVQLLVRKHEGEFDEDSMGYANFILDGAKRMEGMIQQMLDYATLSEKMKKKAWEDVDLNVQVNGAIENLSPKIRESNAEIEVGQLPTVSAQASYIMVVFQNLIENAIKYQKENQKPEINIQSTDKGNYWQISVSDNGIGILKEDFDLVFQMFARKGKSHPVNGAGIGLATCRRILDHHGGQIWVESEGEGQGSVFYFTLPKQRG